jgi:hypothetical protein
MKMSFQGDPDELMKELRALVLRLAERSAYQHGKAIAYGLDKTYVGQRYEAQSHAYANAAEFLNNILAGFENKATPKDDQDIYPGYQG